MNLTGKLLHVGRFTLPALFTIEAGAGATCVCMSGGMWNNCNVIGCVEHLRIALACCKMAQQYSANMAHIQ